MKLNGVIYFYAPKESDLKDRDILREHLCRPTAGRVFLQVDEDHQWTIPFGSTTRLVNILNKIRISENNDLDFSIEKQGAFNGREIDDRRCLRISIVDIDAKYHPMKYAGHLGKEGQDKVERTKFCGESTGMFILLDTDEDYNYRKIFFTDMFDAGIQLDKIFSRETCHRIPVNETVNISAKEERISRRGQKNSRMVEVFGE